MFIYAIKWLIQTPIIRGVLCFSILSAAPLASRAMNESHLLPLYQMAGRLSPLYKGAKGLCQTGVFKANGQNLSYIKCGKAKGQRGALIFINGKEENMLKYLELYYDFQLMGWSPVYSYDHRGQGFSKALAQENLKDLENLKASKEPYYELIKKDLASFAGFVLKDLRGKRPLLFAIAHSMGGAALLDYLQSAGGEAPFKAVALSAPMIQIQPRVFTRDFSLSLLQGFCRALPCRWRLPSLRGQWTKSSFTSSKARFAFSEHITKRFPQARSRGTSLEWLIESFELGQRFMEEKSQAFQQISVPFLILQSPEDGFVSNESQNIFCARLKTCYQIASIPGRHEIFLEKDLSRNQAIETTARFFLKKQQ